jgi:uncharacterized protein (TIGR02594 family)
MANDRLIQLPPRMSITLFEFCQRDVGLKEVDGPKFNPEILAALQLDQTWPKDDAVPWCSAWLNKRCHQLRVARSKSLAARSWLGVGRPIDLQDAMAGWDVVILAGAGPKDPKILDAPGHVGLFAAADLNLVQVLGGNQGNRVCIAPFDISGVLGVRRLWEGGL